jgi:hypothetical protein
MGLRDGVDLTESLLVVVVLDLSSVSDDSLSLVASGSSALNNCRLTPSSSAPSLIRRLFDDDRPGKILVL